MKGAGRRGTKTLEVEIPWTEYDSAVRILQGEGKKNKVEELKRLVVLLRAEEPETAAGSRRRTSSAPRGRKEELLGQAEQLLREKGFTREANELENGNLTVLSPVRSPVRSPKKEKNDSLAPAPKESGWNWSTLLYTGLMVALMAGGIQAARSIDYEDLKDDVDAVVTTYKIVRKAQGITNKYPFLKKKNWENNSLFS